MSTAAFWDNIAEKYARDPIDDPQAYALTRDKMQDMLGPDHRVLELGCGTGSTALELADCTGSYLATDVSPKMIEIAKGKQTDQTPPQLTFRVLDVAAPIEGGHNTVLALNLFHLLPDLEATLQAIYDSLPPGGLMISKTSLVTLAPWYVRWMIPVMQAFGKAPYVRPLRDTDVTALIDAAGFRRTETLRQAGTVPRVFIVAQKP